MGNTAAASLRGATQMFWLHSSGSLMSSIFILIYGTSVTRDYRKRSAQTETSF